MSCYYDIWCTDCGLGLGLEEANHAEEELLGVIEFREQLERLGEGLLAIERSELGGALECTFKLSWWRAPFAPQWFFTHKGHALDVRDEYGKFSSQCRKFLTCDECRERYSCVLSKGHEGACKARKEAW